MRFSIILLKRELSDKTNRKAISRGWASCNRSESLARYSAKYWVISDREEIREWENACNECKNCKLKAGEQVMASLLSVGFRFCRFWRADRNHPRKRIKTCTMTVSWGALCVCPVVGDTQKQSSLIGEQISLV